MKPTRKKVERKPKEETAAPKEKGVGAFDYINSVLKGKDNLMRDTENDELAEKGYVPFLTNRALSFHVDTVLHANEMNMRHGLDPRLQYEYLLGAVRGMNRKYSWIKKAADEAVELVQEAFRVNPRRAREIIALIGEEGIEAARRRMNRGGTVK